MCVPSPVCACGGVHRRGRPPPRLHRHRPRGAGDAAGGEQPDSETSGDVGLAARCGETAPGRGDSLVRGSAPGRGSIPVRGVGSEEGEHPATGSTRRGGASRCGGSAPGRGSIPVRGFGSGEGEHRGAGSTRGGGASRCGGSAPGRGSIPVRARRSPLSAQGGGGSMASPRAAELRSPGEAAAAAAAAAAAGGGGPAGPGAGPGLALALGCALSGAALVVLAGAVPRAARPDPAVPARQMERLEERAARLRARLDRCTVAGLALLALGGLLLAALLLATAAARRRARAARRTGGTYGSVRLRMRRVSAEGTRALLENQLSPPSQPPEGPGS
ncbi:transmembrane protein 74B [Leptosomus discolor]